MLTKRVADVVFWMESLLMTRYGIFFLILAFSHGIQAQQDIPIGNWRTHFSFRDAHSVAITETGAFCAGANSLFFLDLEDNSINKLGKIDGLSDTEISTLSYHQSRQLLVIGYANGNLDLLSDNQVVNISTIMDVPTGTSKSISQITFHQNLAFVCTDFGVAVLDLDQEEIREAYVNIGNNGAVIRVNSGTVFQDTLYLATTQGVIAGGLDPGNNLQDFENWKRFDATTGVPFGEASTVGSTSDRLFVTFDNDGIYHYLGTSWDRIDYQLQTKALHSTSNQSPLIVSTSESLLSINENLQVQEITDELYSKPQSSAIDASGIWVADSLNGLITPINSTPTSIFPNGPFSDSIFRVRHQANQTILLAPGFDRFGNPLRSELGFNVFQDGEWTSYNSSGQSDTEPFPGVKDLVDVVYNGENQRFYLASFGEGIVEWEPDGEIRILDESSPGSTLENIIPGARNVWVSSLLTDSEGSVWAGNYGNSSPIHRYHPQDDSWTSFQVNFQAGRFPLDLKLTDHGDFWVRLDPNNGGSILVINPQSQLQKHLTSTPDQGGLPSRRVNDLEIDKNGQVWVATNDGVVHYPFPFDILENPVVNASPVLIDGRPLLKDEIVTSIAVDGGNRKWIGTENGIWLFSETGDSVIHNFTRVNSPLPSDQVLDISIDGDNGEVFIITNAGLVSFRGSATEGSRGHDMVKIFPNPVTREFQGVVGISGVSNNAVIKVADITGKLVKEFAAAGGTAVWDISDYSGQRVQSGVYLVFSSSPDGNETFIGKIAVIN